MTIFDDAGDWAAEDETGDWIADEEGEAACPWCGEPVTLLLDPGGAATQQYVEDCSVCCRPWDVQVTWDADGRAWVELNPQDGG